MPAPPDPERLLSWTVPDTSHRYGVDPASYTVLAPNAARFIVMILTAGGARNVTLEAVRCDSGERTLLAIARDDGSWAMVPEAAWQTIRRGGPYVRERQPLFAAMCEYKSPVPDAAALARRLQGPNRAF